MLSGLGGIIFLVGSIWLIVLSFQIAGGTLAKILWAVANFLFNPLAGIVFYFVNKAGFVPMILTIVGSLLMGFGLTQSVGDVAP
ncbi:MAG: hypothetical protein H7Z37_16050 [Pyrinomonadaceae bacterium]|nr:hypothetical protein [Pyrinomonadaceae bacterium]